MPHYQYPACRHDHLCEYTAGICPIDSCPKQLINGPCGGVRQGMCEVDTTLPCVWVQIYNYLKTMGDLDKMKDIQGPRNFGSPARRSQG